MSLIEHVRICATTEPGEWTVPSIAADLDVSTSSVADCVKDLRARGQIAPSGYWVMLRDRPLGTAANKPSEATRDKVWAVLRELAKDPRAGLGAQVAEATGLTHGRARKYLAGFREAGDISHIGALFPPLGGQPAMAQHGRAASMAARIRALVADHPGELTNMVVADRLGVHVKQVNDSVFRMRRRGSLGPSYDWRLLRDEPQGRPGDVADAAVGASWSALVELDREGVKPRCLRAAVAKRSGVCIGHAEKCLAAFRRSGDMTKVGALFPVEA